MEEESLDVPLKNYRAEPGKNLGNETGWGLKKKE